MCSKDDEHIQSGTHVACHGYVTNKTTMEFRDATDTPARADSVPKKNKEPVWPANHMLYEYPQDGFYSHLGGDDGPKKK